MNKGSIVKIPDYNPQGIFYGFISKSLPDCSFRFTLQKDRSALSNRQLVLNALGMPQRRLSMLSQVHGTDCLIIDNPSTLGQEVEADGQVTVNKNVVLAINTADCVPVLLHDTKNKVIGICHAGWRGALAGILQSTIQQMLNCEAEISSIEAIIGPCIQQQSYEVSENYYQQFLVENNSNNVFFLDSKRPGHYMFDLPGYVCKKLKDSGIFKIADIKLDTLTNEDRFFSYRLSSLRGKKREGDILSVIGLR